MISRYVVQTLQSKLSVQSMHLDRDIKTIENGCKHQLKYFSRYIGKLLKTIVLFTELYYVMC